MMKVPEPKFDGYTASLAGIAHDGRRPAHAWEEECAEIGGFNPCTNRLTKICCTDPRLMREHLDHITAAVEAGVVRKHGFVEQLFASREDFDEFINYLSEYRVRLHDRWHRALATLSGWTAADDWLATKQELVQALREAGAP